MPGHLGRWASGADGHGDRGLCRRRAGRSSVRAADFDLIRARCSAGISRLAFQAWLLASLLTTARAIAIHVAVFIVLGGTQIVATALIMLYATRYKDTFCPIHLPCEPAAKIATGRPPSR